MTKGGHGNDDIEEVRWFAAEDLKDGFNIEQAHKALLERLVKYFEEKKNATAVPVAAAHSNG